MEIDRNVVYLEIHDASPKFQEELENIFFNLKDCKVSNKIIAIVPYWNYKWNIMKYPKFVRLMKKKEKEGWELALHGYTHSHPQKIPWYSFLFQSKESWEFYKLNYKHTKVLAKKGLDIFKKTFGHMPKGFIPPNWRLSEEGNKAIEDLGFEYVMSIRHIKWFNKKKEKAYIDRLAYFRWKILNLISDFIFLFVKKKRYILHP